MTAVEGQPLDAFVTYVIEDRDWVRELVAKLEAEGVRLLLDEWGFEGGDAVTDRLERILRTTRNVVIVVSQASTRTTSVAQQYAAIARWADDGGRRLIPVLHGQAEVPSSLAGRLWLDFRRPTGPAYDDLVRYLAAILRGDTLLPQDESAWSATNDPWWPRLSPSCRTAFGWAVALRRPGAEVATAALLLGMIRTHRDSEPEVLLRHFGHSAGELLPPIQRRHPADGLDADRPQVLEGMPQLSTNAHGALVEAARLAGSGPVQSSHLFGGLLARTGSGVYTALAAVLQGVDLAEVAASYPDYLRLRPGTSYADFLRERFPTAGAPAEPFRRERAGYVSDVTAMVDRLGFQADVVPLCEVIMAQDVSPPLSIGLFGEWGSGKSTFMQLMQAEIERIARDAREVRREREVAFCTEVRQIRFNAWHYADANLWASLVIHIFEELGAPSGPGADERRRHAAADERKRLIVKLETQRQLLEEAKRRKTAAESARNLALDALKAGGGVVEASIAEDPQVKQAKERIEQDLGLMDVTPAKVEEVAGDLADLPGQVRKAWRLLRRPLELAAVVVPIVLAIGLGVAVYAVVQSGVAAWAVALALGSIGTLTGFVAGPLAAARSIGGAAMRAARRIESARETTRNELQQRVHDAEEAVRAVEVEVAEIREGRRLRRFIEDRSRSSDYLSHLGIVSLIRSDFEELSRLLEDNRRARLAAKASPHKDLPGIDRVILYIDDLDRCSNVQVVQVLEAVHLLLAFDIFVAVVSVDPRWLVRSLGQRYPDQLRSDDEDDHAATPLDYLEKIFQIPFAVRPMGRTGYQSLVGAVLPVRAAPRRPEPSAPAAADAPQPSPEPSQPYDQVTPGAVVRDHDPENLRVHDHELQFVQALWPIIATPRAAKRLINTYRLIRASQPEAEFQALVCEDPPGDHQIVLLLLAALIGFPSAASALFDDLLTSSPDQDFWALVEARPASWSDLAGALLQLRPASATGFTASRVRPWIPRVARYSFQTVRLPSE